MLKNKVTFGFVVYRCWGYQGKESEHCSKVMSKMCYFKVVNPHSELLQSFVCRLHFTVTFKARYFILFCRKFNFELSPFSCLSNKWYSNTCFIFNLYMRCFSCHFIRFNKAILDSGVYIYTFTMDFINNHEPQSKLADASIFSCTHHSLNLCLQITIMCMTLFANLPQSWAPWCREDFQEAGLSGFVAPNQGTHTALRASSCLM